MKRSALLFAILFSVTSYAGVEPNNATHLNSVYRFFRPYHGHLLTLNYQEGVSHGFQYEGVAFKVLRHPYAGTIPLYRCAIAGTAFKFVSTDSYCEWQQTEGIYGYVHAGYVPGTRQLYRCYHHQSGDHLSTVNPHECSLAGYQVEGGQGFVY